MKIANSDDKENTKNKSCKKTKIFENIKKTKCESLSSHHDNIENLEPSCRKCLFCLFHNQKMKVKVKRVIVSTLNNDVVRDKEKCNIYNLFCLFDYIIFIIFFLFIGNVSYNIFCCSCDNYLYTKDEINSYQCIQCNDRTKSIEAPPSVDHLLSMLDEPLTPILKDLGNIEFDFTMID